MELAVHFSNFSLPGQPASLPDLLAGTARAAEEGGLAQMTLMDHYFQIPPISPRAEEPMLEGYTALGYLAAVTSRIRLGLLVTGVTYRHPGLLAKVVTTLDVLSAGRAELGIGAAWFDREHHGLGVPYPPTAQRFELLEEAILICRQMWSDDDGPFEGTRYRLAETLCSPRPIQPGGPPILIGGGGEKKTLRLVARYGDACNLFGQDHAFVAGKLDVLRRHCDELGTDYDRIRKTIIVAGPDRGGLDAAADPDAFLSEMEGYARLGVTQVWNGPMSGDPAGWTARAAEAVVPRLAQL